MNAFISNCRSRLVTHPSQHPHLNYHSFYIWVVYRLLNICLSYSRPIKLVLQFLMVCINHKALQKHVSTSSTLFYSMGNILFNLSLLMDDWTKKTKNCHFGVPLVINLNYSHISTPTFIKIALHIYRFYTSEPLNSMHPSIYQLSSLVNQNYIIGKQQTPWTFHVYA